MKRLSPFLTAIGSGILLWGAWPVSPFTLFIFIAWVPLLWLESITKSRKRFFGFTYITMFSWNILTTWWVLNASLPGALGAFFANSLLMCFPWLGYSIAKKWLGEKWGYTALIAFWMCFEYIHLHDWGLSWPWLTLGNVFSNHPSWIQWYEYTGTSGGTLWVLVINVLLFLHIKNNFNRDTAKSYKHLLTAVVLLATPLTISWIINRTRETVISNHNIVVVQPNVDPYEKIAAGTFESQLQKLIRLSEKEIDNNTSLVVWPETALYIGNGIEEDKMKENFFLNPLWGFLRRHPQITLFTGVESYRVYTSAKTSTAKSAGAGYFYDAFNAGVLIDSSGTKSFYHKSMLVPGVETLPWFLKFIDTWFEKFGGTTSGYAKQKERTVLTDSGHDYKIAPAICYESIYGEFMSKYVQNGANIICIITNDGWWGNTPGYKQHMSYARLRAIETRKWIVRSANTGISCFIDPYGIAVDPQPYNIATAIKRGVPVNDDKTFYVKYGDLLSKLMVIASIVLFVWTIVLWMQKRFYRKGSTSV